MRPLASPLIPIYIFFNERWGIIPHALDRGAVRGGWAGPPTTQALIKHVVFVEVPRVTQAIFTYEFVTSVIQVLKALVYVRAEETVLVVHYRARALVTLFTLDVYVEWYQGLLSALSCSLDFKLEGAHSWNGWWHDSWWLKYHSSDVKQLESVSKGQQCIQETEVSAQVVKYWRQSVEVWKWLIRIISFSFLCHLKFSIERIIIISHTSGKVHFEFW